jgi:hypothetical protein
MALQQIRCLGVPRNLRSVVVASELGFPNDEPDSSDTNPSVLEEQLDLKLEFAKAPVNVVIINHNERLKELSSFAELKTYLLEPNTILMSVSTDTGWLSSM